MRHILDLSNQPAKLRVKNQLLVIECKEGEVYTVPLAEVAVVILANPQISCTQAVLSGLALAGAMLISCDQRHLPVAMMMPLYGYHAPARRLIAQADATKPVCKRLWQRIVKAKIISQGMLLAEVTGSDWGLLEMAESVRSGDPENLEAQAARVYWGKLWNEKFVRNPDAEDQNRYLNYGYAILRAVVCRAICAAGLHPGLGIHHHHRENAFCLADDLIEPLRPIVDRNVVEFVKQYGVNAPMNKVAKEHLLQIAEQRCWIEGENRSIFEVAEMMASSMAQVFEGAREGMILPDAKKSLVAPAKMA